MSFLSPILNLLFPPRCASCKREGDFLCRDCIAQLNIKQIRFRSSSEAVHEFRYLDAVIYGLDYSQNPQIKAALAQFKYKFTLELVEHFSALTAQKLAELNMLRGRNIALIPVPLHKRRLDYRGFNQAQHLAVATAQRVGERAEVHPMIRRVKDTAQQAKLGRQERLENLHDAFRFEGSADTLRGTIVFLVDDVCTTGATLDSCARVLKEAGISKVYGLVVARAFK